MKKRCQMCGKEIGNGKRKTMHGECRNQLKTARIMGPYHRKRGEIDKAIPYENLVTMFEANREGVSL